MCSDAARVRLGAAPAHRVRIAAAPRLQRVSWRWSSWRTWRAPIRSGARAGHHRRGRGAGARSGGSDLRIRAQWTRRSQTVMQNRRHGLHRARPGVGDRGDGSAAASSSRRTSSSSRPAADVIAATRDADVVVVNMVPITPEVIAGLAEVPAGDPPRRGLRQRRRQGAERRGHPALLHSGLLCRGSRRAGHRADHGLRAAGGEQPQGARRFFRRRQVGLQSHDPRIPHGRADAAASSAAAASARWSTRNCAASASSSWSATRTSRTSASASWASKPWTMRRSSASPTSSPSTRRSRRRRATS